MTAVDNKNAPSKFTNGTQLILMKNGIKTSIDQALAGLKEFDNKKYNNIKNNLSERIFYYHSRRCSGIRLIAQRKM